MGVLWFSAFVLLGLLMRKLKFPIKFSVVPLLLLLVLSILRMFVAIDLPWAVVIFSEIIYPTIINLARHDILHYQVFGIPINVATIFIFVWIVVALCLITKYLYDYIVKFRHIMNWLGSSKRDEYAESLLISEVGANKKLRVFRNKCLGTAVTTDFRPYIILPEVEFSSDELRVILLHEWKHIRDKDYLTKIIINLICFVFWWNPLLYVLRKNFHFAKELKCDQFAVTTDNDFNHFLEGLLVLDTERKRKKEKFVKLEGFNALAGSVSILEERLKVLALKGESRVKRIFASVCYSITIVVLFLASYMFMIVPMFWEATDVNVIAENLMEDYLETGGIFRAEENFIVDNGDGTFSLYIEGQFMMFVEDTHDFFEWLPVRIRTDD